MLQQVIKRGLGGREEEHPRVKTIWPTDVGSGGKIHISGAMMIGGGEGG